MSKHTPGPWETDNGDNEVNYRKSHPDCITIKDATGWHIARVWLDGKSGTAEANARLIAAAPELLDACECAQNRLQQLEDEGFESGQVDAYGRITTLEHLKAAIAKATS